MAVSNKLIVGIGGTVRPNSTTEQALAHALRVAEKEGARTQLFGHQTLVALPHYLTDASHNSPDARLLVEGIRGADGIIIASPGYHGSISGLVKNALDYIEETAKDSRIYLDGLPVGLISVAYGAQAAGNTLNTLRCIVHALRGWPTPMGAALNSANGIFRDGVCVDDAAARALSLIGSQVASFHGAAPPLT